MVTPFYGAQCNDCTYLWHTYIAVLYSVTV